jgi:hypothetical protein
MPNRSCSSGQPGVCPDRERPQLENLGWHRSESGTGWRHVGQIRQVLDDVYTGGQELGMRWTLPAGLRIIDVDRVDANEDCAFLDQVRRGLTIEVRPPMAYAGVPKCRSQPVCKSTALPSSSRS